MRRTTWKLAYTAGTMVEGEYQAKDVVFYIEHEMTPERHRIIVDGIEGPWAFHNRIAVRGEYRASTDAHPELPEIFTTSSLGCERVQ